MPPSPTAKRLNREAHNPLQRNKGLNPIAPGLETATRDLTDDDDLEVQVVEKVVEVPTVVVLEDGSIPAGQFRLTRKGLIAANNPTFEEWAQVGDALFQLEDGIQWLLGDWLVYGEDFFDQSREAIAQRVGREVKTLDNYAWVCRSLPYSLRRELSFGHHMLVAGLDSDERKIYWLNEAVVGKWSVAQMREQMKVKTLLPETEYGWLFEQNNLPKLSSAKLQKLYFRALHGDSKSKKSLEKTLDEIEEWVNSVRRVIK